MATGSNDVYLVRSGEKEYLIPAIEDVVVEINLAAGVMTVSPLEGLLEL
jgi:16S rRNA processing protein RimM